MKKTGLRTQKLVFILVLAALLMIVGCSNNSNKENDKNKDKNAAINTNINKDDDNNVEEANGNDNEEEEVKEDVTITIAHPFGEDLFETRYGSIPNLPEHITLDWVQWDESRAGLEELFSQGIKPDIFNSGSVELLKEYDAIIPIDELSEKYDFDTSVIQPSLVTFLESYDDEQRLIGVPDGGSYYALYFNKEIFDIFGEHYPDLDEPMTWSEVLDLARNLTAERNGTEYVGLEFHNNDISAPFNQFGLNLTDPETGAVLVNDKPEVKQYFDMFREYNDIPGINSEDIAQSCAFCEKKAAMSIAWHGLYLGGWGDDPSIAENMDIAPLPVWPELPNTGPYLSSYPIMVSDLNGNEDDAFQVLVGYVSEENQLAMSKAVSAGPATTYESVQENFAADNEFYDGKNVTAIFALEPALGEQRQSGKWDGYVGIGTALNKIATTDIDVPTLLRELQEEAEISIEEAKEMGE